MRINPIHTQIVNEVRKTDATARKAETPQKVLKAYRSDSAGFSDDAKKLSSRADAATVAANVASLPEVRMDKVEEVKKKIASGYYNSAEFNDKLADKLAKEFGA